MGTPATAPPSASAAAATTARRRVWPIGLRSLRHRNYRLFFSGQTVSVVGTWMQSTAQGWLVYRLTGSALLLGLVGFADRGPVFLLGLAGGVAADRFDRRRVVILTQAASLAQALALGLLVTLGAADVAWIFLLAAAGGVIAAFDIPARQSLIAEMVEQDDLPNALALNSTLFNAARVVGPALAGLMVAAAGEGVCFLLNAVSFAAVIACLVRLRLAPRAPGGAGVSLRRHLEEGLRFAAGRPPVRALLVLLGLVSVCGMPYVTLMPVFASDVLGRGAPGLGALMAAAGLGACVAAAALARRRSVAGLGRVIAGGSIGFGVSLGVFALSTSFPLSLALLVAVGFFMIAESAATNVLLQALTPDALRGRVMSLYTIMFVGTTPFGILLAGLVADRIGASATVAVGGAACALGGAVFALRIPSMRRFVRYPIPITPLPGDSPRVDTPGAGV